MERLGVCSECSRCIVISVPPEPSIVEMVNGTALFFCICGSPLGLQNFGYDHGGNKIRWVGPDHAWTDQKPTEMFAIEIDATWYVAVDIPSNDESFSMTPVSFLLVDQDDPN